jgi:hypothetical protein
MKDFPLAKLWSVFSGARLSLQDDALVRIEEASVPVIGIGTNF